MYPPDGPTPYLKLSNFSYDDQRITLTGTVASIDERSLTMAASPDWALTIDTSGLADNPLDDVGRPQMRPGDRIQITGRLDRALFADSRIIASQ